MGITVSGRFILASASPRRIGLLKLVGLECDVIPGRVDEAFLPSESPREHVLRLSEEKALRVARCHPAAWVLGADTIVVIAGEILGKPGSPAEAEAMLRKLSGREHAVFTGFSIVHLDQAIRIREVVESSVLFRRIADEEMIWYTGTEEPYDKAGAYAVQGMGGRFIEAIRGSCTNVMGLPLGDVVGALKRVAAIVYSGDGHGHCR